MNNRPDMRVVSDPEAWRALRPEWNRLADSIPGVSVFSRWEWQFAWWRQFGGGARLHIMVFEDGRGEIKAVFPFYIRGESVRGLMRFRVLSYICHNYSDYLTAICGDPEYARMACRHLRRLHPGLIYDFANVAENDPFLGELAATGRTFEAGETSCPYLAVPDDREHFWRSLGQRTRKNIRRGLERLAPGPEPGVLTDHPSIERALEGTMGFQERRFGGAAPKNEEREKYRLFVTEAARGLCAEGIAKMFLLGRPESPAAYQFCLDYKGRRSFVLGGFDPALARHSPGKCITALAIMEAVGGKCREYDFLSGDEGYKRLFAREKRTCRSLKGGFSAAANLLYRTANGLSDIYRRAGGRGGR